LRALQNLLRYLPESGDFAVLIAYHIQAGATDAHIQLLQKICPWPTLIPKDKEPILRGVVYFAPAGYHMLVEQGGSISLSMDEKVNYCRPAIDVLFESAAAYWRERVCAFILTGANDDGARGCEKVLQFGGRVYIQSPDEAEFSVMPEAALQHCPDARSAQLTELGQILKDPFPNPVNTQTTDNKP
jgi:two-component system chemotaxis response regulator CheB